MGSLSAEEGTGSAREPFRRGIRRAPVGLVALTLVVALVASACGGTTPSASAPVRARLAAASKPILPITICCAWGSTWSYNPFNSYFPGGVLYGFVDLPLAVQVPPTITKYSPQAASSWTSAGDKLTVHLRPDLKWQNGRKFTSKDVYDTALLDGTDGGLWGDISDVAAPSKSVVTFTIRKGVPMALAEETVLGMTPFPSSEFGRFLTPSLKADEIAYYNKNATDPSAASNMPQYKAIGKVFTKLSSFSPKSAIGDGPFTLKNMNTLEATLLAWKGFFAASKIHMAGIDYYNGTTNQVMYPWMYSGKTDWTWSYFPPNIVSHFLSLPNTHIELTSPQDEYNLEFNDHQYPMNITKVRQALAYVIPRNKMISITYGTKDPDGVSEERPDGVTPSVQKLYLTKKQISELNPYPVNTTKAAALLRSVGFKKSGNQWITPKGKPFTLNLIVNNAESDIETSMDVAAQALSTFGIHSTVSAVSGAVAGADQGKGDFQVGSSIPDSLDPLTELDAMMGTGNNFSTLGTYAGDRGMGFGPKVNVPGLGMVDVPTTIDHEATTVSPGKRMDELVWDWARLVNQQVPFLQYGNKVWQMSYSTAKFKGWPTVKSNLWNTVGYNLGGGWLLILESGKLKPAV